ncbi:hypothetical protein BDZ94DRAFT_1313650 [Collybia nuda]|uniref:Uncharacterized protein n=1 Tax=Collybia nuda TaxID=64659 RepID=A0A9P5XWF3_9AGAR|nr:hypothetical protein BDZ94DRAFT_1313650 [Collybia nuda]
MNHIEPYPPHIPPDPTLEGQSDYDFPENPYGYGMYYEGDNDSGPPQVGGGIYHGRLRPTINLSPNATRTAQKSAQYRKEAVQQATLPGDLQNLDDATLVSLAVDASWNLSPANSPSIPKITLSHTTPLPGAPAHSTDGIAPQPPAGPVSNPEGFPLNIPPPSPNATIQAMRSPVSPTPNQERFKGAVFNVMGFQPLKIPPPPDPDHTGDKHGSAGGKSDGHKKAADEYASDDMSGGNNELPGDAEGGTDNEESDSDGSGGSHGPKMGRPTTVTQVQILQLFKQVDSLFKKASYETGRPVSSLVDRWNSRSKHRTKGSSWNSYQHYFGKNREKERLRAGLPEGTARECYESFKTLPHRQEALKKFAELELTKEEGTLAQRQRGFKKIVDSFQHLTEEASRDRIESLVFLAGNSVNEDGNLAHLHTSDDLNDFLHDKLHINASEFMGIAKTHIYQKVAEAFVAELETTKPYTWTQLAKSHPWEPVETPKSSSKPGTSQSRQKKKNFTAPVGALSPPPNLSPVQQQQAEKDDGYVLTAITDRARTVDDDRMDCKSHFFRLFQTSGLDVPITRSQFMLPWLGKKGLLAQLLLWRVQLMNWPANVPFPSEPVPGSAKRPSQGIKSLPGKHVRCLLASFHDPKTRMWINRNVPAKDLERNQQPIIITGPPASESNLAFGRRQFGSGDIDQKGPARLPPSPAATKIKKAKAKPPPSDVEILDISSSSPPSGRTRSREKRKNKSKVIVDSSDNDDPSTGQVPEIKVPAHVQQLELTSDDEYQPNGGEDEVNMATGEEDSDPDGVLVADPDDDEYDGNNKIEWYAKKSPRKPLKASTKGKGKADAKGNVEEPSQRKAKAPQTSPSQVTPVPPGSTERPSRPLPRPIARKVSVVETAEPGDTGMEGLEDETERINKVLEIFQDGVVRQTKTPSGEHTTKRARADDEATFTEDTKPVSMGQRSMENPVGGIVHVPKRARVEAVTATLPLLSAPAEDLPSGQPNLCHTSTQPLEDSPHALPAPHHLSVQSPEDNSRAPSVPPRLSTQPRPPSAQPRAQSTQPPHYHPFSPYPLPPADYSFPMTGPQSAPYGHSIPHQGMAGSHGHMPYTMPPPPAIHGDTGGPGGRGHGSGPSVAHPHLHNSAAHAGAPYLQPFQAPYNPGGYYGPNWGYNTYGYPPNYPVSHYPTSTYREPGPSGYHGRHGGYGNQVYEDAEAVVKAEQAYDAPVTTDPGTTTERISEEGWSGVERSDDSIDIK